MPREKKEQADQNVTPKTLLEMTEDPGSAPGVPLGEPTEIESRLNVLEQGMAKIIKVITGGEEAPPAGVDAQGGASSQRNELIEVLKLATAKPKTDDFSSFSKEFMMDIVKASTAGLKSYYTRLGGALGDQEVAARITKEGTHVITSKK